MSPLTRGPIGSAAGGLMIWLRRRAGLLSPTGHGRKKLVRFGVSATRLRRRHERHERESERLAISAAAIRKADRDATQRAAAAASGQALPLQLQRPGRRQKTSGLLPMPGDGAD